MKRCCLIQAKKMKLYYKLNGKKNCNKQNERVMAEAWIRYYTARQSIHQQANSSQVNSKAVHGQKAHIFLFQIRYFDYTVSIVICTTV